MPGEKVAEVLTEQADRRYGWFRAALAERRLPWFTKEARDNGVLDPSVLVSAGRRGRC